MEKHIAIVGAGVGGLMAAYFLHGSQSHDKKDTFFCTVFDVCPRIGGNVFSAYLGDEGYEKPFVDLGVNDFNTATYHAVNEVLQRLGNEGFPVPTAPLIDTATWYTPRGVKEGARTYTSDEMAHWREHPDKPWLESISKDWDSFICTAKEVLEEPKYQDMSVDEFIKVKGYSADFAEYNLLARINGMYYMNGILPGKMPIRGVMSYYHLQENIGEHMSSSQFRNFRAAPSSRHYFVNGASSLVQQLRKCLVARGAKMRVGRAPFAHYEPNFNTLEPWRVLSEATPPGERETFHSVVSAVHADRVSAAIVSGLPPGIATILAQFTYLDSISIVHDDPRMLPEDESQWSTYNILVYPPGTRMLRPYTITYVDRKHQGEDSNKPPFLTLTPYGAVPSENIPTMLDPVGLELPDKARIKAIAYMRHNTLSVDAMRAQRALHRFQGVNGIWFTGGWTNGAGLLEEITQKSKEIVATMRGIPAAVGDGETYRDDDVNHVPRYFRETFAAGTRALGATAAAPKPFPDGFWG